MLESRLLKSRYWLYLVQASNPFHSRRALVGLSPTSEENLASSPYFFL